MREKLDWRLEGFEMFKQEVDWVLIQESSWTRTVSDADHNQKRLFLHDDPEGLGESVPILFIENTHEIEKQRLLFLLFLLALLLRLGWCFLLLISFILLLFLQPLLLFFLLGQVILQFFEFLLTVFFEFEIPLYHHFLALDLVLFDCLHSLQEALIVW